MNKYKHYKPGFNGAIFTFLCNFKTLRNLRRILFQKLPFLKLKSEVKDIIYLNWLVDYDEAVRFSGGNTQLFRLGDKTILTVLCYQHGHFRPAIFSLFKPLFPSPLQSNWRFYLESADKTVLFLKNVMSSPLFVLGTRLFSDAMYTHLPAKFSLEVSDKVSFDLDPGIGSSPDINGVAEFDTEHRLPVELLQKFGSVENVLKFLCHQDQALTLGDDYEKDCLSEISLPIDIATVVPMRIDRVESRDFGGLIKDGKCFGFYVPAVDFEILGEKNI